MEKNIYVVGVCLRSGAACASGLYASLGEYRLQMSSDPLKFKLLNRRGRLIDGLKEFIKTA